MRDADLFIARSLDGAIVVERCLARGELARNVEAVLGRPPDSGIGGRYWEVSPADAAAILAQRHPDGATPDEIREWAKDYPTPAFWWTVSDSY